jgi:hypothetical protein
LLHFCLFVYLLFYYVCLFVYLCICHFNKIDSLYIRLLVFLLFQNVCLLSTCLSVFSIRLFLCIIVYLCLPAISKCLCDVYLSSMFVFLSIFTFYRTSFCSLALVSDAHALTFIFLKFIFSKSRLYFVYFVYTLYLHTREC